MHKDREKAYHVKVHMPDDMGNILEQEKLRTGKTMSYLVRQALAKKYNLKLEYKHGNYEES